MKPTNNIRVVFGFTHLQGLHSIQVSSVGWAELRRSPPSLQRHFIQLFADRKAPAFGIYPSGLEVPKSAMLPCRGRLHETMLHWIIVDVITKTVEVILVPHQMFPEPSLPYRLLPLIPAGYRKIFPFCFISSAEVAFYKIPSYGKATISFGKGPYHVQMIGEYHIRIDDKRMVPRMISRQLFKRVTSSSPWKTGYL